MDILLGKITQQAINYAIRSGIAITAGYAIRQSARLVKRVDGNEKLELQAVQERLKGKIDIIAPAIDMIELIAARGNTSLESAISLTKALRWDLQCISKRIAAVVEADDQARRIGGKEKVKAAQRLNEAEIILIIQDIKKFLNRIEDAVPLINLAITTSGVKLSTTLPSTVSPSRLLQASTLLTAGDAQYIAAPGNAVQIGPTFTLSLYMLFSGHIRPVDEAGAREMTWKEVIHKARVKLRRVPLQQMYGLDISSQASGYFDASSRADEFAYQILIIEDLEDDRVHTFEDENVRPKPYDEVNVAGIREIIPIHEVSRIFYADTGKILNIGADDEAHNPVLLLKRDSQAAPPRKMMENPDAYSDQAEESCVSRDAVETGDSQAAIDAQLSREAQMKQRFVNKIQRPAPSPAPAVFRLPADLDPEWLAFEVYEDNDDSSTEGGEQSETSFVNSSSVRQSDEASTSQANSSSVDPSINSSIASLSLHRNRTPSSSQVAISSFHYPQIRTSLSLLETLLRLSSLQQFQQQPHLSITDELLTFFLEESSSTGAGGNSEERKKLRGEARRKVGWDPYDESPVKRRGEDYQYGEGGRRSREDSTREYDDASANEDTGYYYNDNSRLEETFSDLESNDKEHRSDSDAPRYVQSLSARLGLSSPESSGSSPISQPSLSPSPSLARAAFLRKQLARGNVTSAGFDARRGGKNVAR